MRSFIKNGRFLLLLLILGLFSPQATLKAGGGLVFPLDSTGNRYLKLEVLAQVWGRYILLNPGSMVDGQIAKQTFDIGIRRFRFTAMGQPSKRVFFYTQFGINNFQALSNKFSGLFLHDAVLEYRLIPEIVSIGGGLAGWNGVSRCAACSIGSILAIDVPVYQQASVNLSDQFVRKFSIYAKGKVGGLDYRLILSRPMQIRNGTGPGSVSDFAIGPPSPQFHGYFKYDFFEREENLTPYLPGTYLGRKKVLSLGAGALYQARAMWHLEGNDTLREPLILLGIDLFTDLPLNPKKNNAVTAYLALNCYEMGKNYVRNLGIMNPANGLGAGATFNGTGTAFPMIGTGTTSLIQVGYKFRDGFLPPNSSLQPYFSSQYSLYEGLDAPMWMWEGGFNILINNSHDSKVTFNVQDRPVFRVDGNGRRIEAERRPQFQVQYQVKI